MYEYNNRLVNNIVKLYEKYKDNNGIVKLPYAIKPYDDILYDDVGKTKDKNITSLVVVGFKVNYFIYRRK